MHLPLDVGRKSEKPAIIYGLSARSRQNTAQIHIMQILYYQTHKE